MLRYVDNPNGSVDDIAGICNEAGNVVGLMPHPERASDALLGSDGRARAAALAGGARPPPARGRRPDDPTRHGAPSVRHDVVPGATTYRRLRRVPRMRPGHAYGAPAAVVSARRRGRVPTVAPSPGRRRCALVAVAPAARRRPSRGDARTRPGARATVSGPVDRRELFEPGACMEYPPTSGDRHLTVFLDAGHGGLDPGGVGETESGQTIDEADETLPVELDTMAAAAGQGLHGGGVADEGTRR